MGHKKSRLKNKENPVGFRLTGGCESGIQFTAKPSWGQNSSIVLSVLGEAAFMSGDWERI
jgi:hypothetical protein